MLREGTLTELGSVAWFAIMETSITHTELAEAFARVGLDQRFLPRPALPVDAFRWATSTAKKRFTYDGVDCRLFVEETRTDADKVTRRIMLERRPKGRKLSVDAAGEANFFRQGRSAQSRVAGSAKLRFTVNQRLAKPESEAVRAFTKEIQATYEQLSEHLGQIPLRMVVRRYLEIELRAVPVKPSGGIFFVQSRHRAGLESLESVVNSWPGESMMHSVPLPDEPKNRELVRTYVSREAEADLRTLINKLAVTRLDAEGKPTVAALATLESDYQLIVDRVEGILGVSEHHLPDHVSEMLDTALDALKKLEP